MPAFEDALNKFVAPNLSALNQNSAPEIRSHFSSSGRWITIYILNRIVGSTLVGTTHPIVINYLRRVHSALEEYSEAGEHLTSFINRPTDTISEYFSAVEHYESAVSLTYQSSMLLRVILHEHKFFEKNDGSPIERLNLLYNHTKHIEKIITNGQLADDYSLPMWISNTGLHCSASWVTFAELADILEVLATNAERLYAPSLSQDKPKG